MASLFQRDESGNQIIRVMIAEDSSKYKSKVFSFVSSKYGSIYCKNRLGQDIQEIFIHFYNSADEELVFQGIGYETETEEQFQTRLTNGCVKTVSYIEQSSTFWLRGAEFRVKAIPTESVYLFATMAGHISAEYGGDVRFIDGGFDLSYLTEQHNFVSFDGGAATKVNYDDAYYSHRLYVQLLHPVGFQLGVQVKIENYI